MVKRCLFSCCAELTAITTESSLRIRAPDTSSLPAEKRTSMSRAAASSLTGTGGRETELFSRSFLASNSISLRFRIVASIGQCYVHCLKPISAGEGHVLIDLGSLDEFGCGQQILQFHGEQLRNMVEGVQLNWLAALLDVGDGGPRKSQLSREHLLRHFFLVSGLSEYSAKLAVKELVV